ncbi:MAG: ion channel [Planctomycetota bacterium]|jgi:hypothetical protein
MKWIDLENVMENKYNPLLAGEILFMLIYPFIEVLEIEFPVMGCLFLMVLIPALHAVLPFKAFVYLMSLGVFGVLLRILAYFNLFPNEIDRIVVLLIDVSIVTFVLLVIIILIKRISSRRVVTADTIKGGISVYFLIGILWTYLYLILLQITPNALSHASGEMVDCVYYSFATLTTLGPGDIAPTSVHAKFLAILEAFVGQVYLAIFIAQLIGLHLVRRLQATK